MKVNETMNKEGLHLRREFESMRDLIEEAAKLYEGKIAYSYRLNPRDKDAVKVTFTQLRDDVRALATEFISRGYDSKKCALVAKLKRTGLYIKADQLYELLIKRKEIYTKMYEQEFEEGGKYLEYTKDKYMMIWPKKYEDLCLEAEEQNNCLRDYIEDVVRGYTKIYFMRKVNSPNESCITVEIHGNEICQAFGKNNRTLTEEEYAWLEDYAYEMGLFIDVEVDYFDFGL